MKLYNTLSRQTEELKPLEPGKVRLYACGLTVYSQPHIGNWISYIYWDILVRTLKAEGLIVSHTQNITDVGHLTSDDDSGEDKMEKGAKREGITAWDVASKYISIAEVEARKLNLLPPDNLARATDYIDDQIAFAEDLDSKGYLYKIDGDGMYFDTSKVKDYGKLAKLDIEGLEAGSRVSVEGKRNITDFAVWKFSPEDKTRDMQWESPWGLGFPGWHLECSVIARETLGDQIDIHTGGIDHIPVHHTNEIAQTESVTGQQFSQVWLHSNHIKSDGQKMSKSLGNIYTLSDIEERGINLSAFRLFALSKHYSTEGNFTWDNLESAANTLKKWQTSGALIYQPSDQPITYTAKDIENDAAKLLEYLQDNLDTVKYKSVIDNAMGRFLYSGRSHETCEAMISFINRINDLSGINLKTTDISQEQKDLIAQRIDAKNSNNWDVADSIRGQLLEQGIAVNDLPGGTFWHRA